MAVLICQDRNVFYVDFTTGWRKEASDLLKLSGLSNTYLDICAATLDQDDYIELLQGIVDYNFYQSCDTVIRNLVDGYFNHEAIEKG